METEALFALVKEGSYKQLQVCFESGYDINCRNERQETPIMYSMVFVHDSARRAKVMRMLIDAGCYVNCQNTRGQTPLMYACILNHPDALLTLLDSPSINCNVQDLEGNTALMYACAMGNTESVRVLVTKVQESRIDVDINISNMEGATALMYALDGRYDDITALLESIGASVEREEQAEENTEFHQPVSSKSKSGTDLIQSVSKSVEFVTDSKRSNVVLWREGSDGKPEVALRMEKSPQRSNAVRTQEPEAVQSHDQQSACAPNQTNGKMYRMPLSLNREDLQNLLAMQSKAKASDNGPKEEKSIFHGVSGSSVNTCISQMMSKQADPEESKPVKKGFGEEYAFCDKIFPANPWPKPAKCTGNEPAQTQEKQKWSESSNLFVRFLSMLNEQKCDDNSPAFPSEEGIGTGKIDILHLSPGMKAKLLSRAIWSIYGNPLPPIPLTEETAGRMEEELTKLRNNNLIRANYQPGRLLRLDPELWCIVESIRTTQNQTAR